MASYRSYAVMKRNQFDASYVGWERFRKSHTYKMSMMDVIITEEELQKLKKRMEKESADYSLHWVVKRPGGSVYDYTYVVKFYNKNSLMKFKLARIV